MTSAAGAAETDQMLRGRIGQMLLIGFRGTSITDTSPINRMITDINPGGIILFDYDVPSQSTPRNIIDFKQTRQLIRDLQAQSPIPLLIAIDVEGGRVNRLKPEYGFADIPSAEDIGRLSIEDAAKIYQRLARQLADLGINLNLAPVVDLDLNPENPVIGGIQRSFSSEPETVIQISEVFIREHRKTGVLTALKHFPGHGSSGEDSHLGVVDISRTYQEVELSPFRTLIERDLADIIMTAHVINRKIDPVRPATLSPNFLVNLLRKDLEFKGVIISDDMQMEAIRRQYGFEKALIMAVNAGCDILAISNNSRIYDENAVYTARDTIYRAVKSGKIPAGTISRSAERIKRLKQKIGLIN